MTDQDIRVWAKARGLDIKDSGPVPASIRNRYADDMGGEVDSDSSATEGAKIEERAPQEGPSTSSGEVPSSTFGRVRERARRRFWDSGKTDRMLISQPKRSARPRVAIDRLIQRVWGALSDVTRPVNLPVSRVLALQSPVAGLLLEETIRNTTVDRLLQPLARAGAHAEVAHALLGPPLITLALTTRPQLAPVLLPLLKDALRTWVDVAGPQIEKAAKREAEYQASYGGTIDALIVHIFPELYEDESPDGRAGERAAS